tara:strand:- start:33 stop:431 length:399 start_codon:yes stop_codon:yes gene_type:complete
MDILFYISGLITTLLVVLVFASIHAYTKFKTLIEYSEFVNSEAEQRYNEMSAWRNKLDPLVENNQEDNETELYESIAKINNTLEILTDQLHGVKTDVLSFNNAVEANFSKIYNDISSIRNNQQSPTQDIDRY